MISLRRFKIGKLVRDKYPVLLERQGGRALTRSLSPQELPSHLKLKLQEEIEEFLMARTAEDLKEEMADILEVLEALAVTNGFEMSEVEQIRLQKHQTRGGFGKGLFADSIEITTSGPSSSFLQYYLDHPEKYPEISSNVDDESYR